MPVFFLLSGIYFGALNLIGVMAALLDKHRAKKGGWRISETRLMLLGALGGALLEWLTMRLIHHKTTRKKFMVGLPLMVLLHAALWCALLTLVLFWQKL
ncbi:MAG: DUF1294 domain-containing protein [Oscillospiraceae bacterium]|nr:DUF1294 domain-containing protein [Oscillospiraceae bacterium]